MLMLFSPFWFCAGEGENEWVGSDPGFMWKQRSMRKLSQVILRFTLDKLGKMSFMVVKQWKGLFKEMMGPSSPEEFMRYVDVALRDTV